MPQSVTAVTVTPLLHTGHMSRYANPQGNVVVRADRERVFRRRRLLAAAVLAAAAFAAGVLLAVAVFSTPAGSSLTDEAQQAQQALQARQEPQVRHVVEPGDTLWGVAERIAPEADPRVVVDELAAARDTTTLLPGEVVVWPTDR